MKRIIASLILGIALFLPAVANAADGGGGNDVIHGTPGPDVIFGGSGDDVIYSGGGQDSVWGGPGFDICYVGPKDAFSGCEDVR